ncbi:hypothetical protein [Chitinophaga dinghuensis]|nr:hypothetical protein [Chitinophaga dinghuensis]
MMSYLTVSTVAEWSCFCIAFFCLRTDKDPLWKWFPAYLLIVCLVETTGIYIRTTWHVTNAPLYNLYLPIECIFVSSFLFHQLRNFGLKRTWLYAWLTLFTGLYLTESISNNWERYSRQVVVLMSVIFVLAALYYFYLVLRSEQYIRLGGHGPFWWVSGVLMFYFGGVVTYIFFTYLLQAPASDSIQYSVRYIIFKVLNVILYGSWAYACICRYRQLK